MILKTHLLLDNRNDSLFLFNVEMLHNILIKTLFNSQLFIIFFVFFLTYLFIFEVIGVLLVLALFVFSFFLVFLLLFFIFLVFLAVTFVIIHEVTSGIVKVFLALFLFLVRLVNLNFTFGLFELLKFRIWRSSKFHFEMLG